MTTTTFITGTTIEADWLNDVDNTVYGGQLAFPAVQNASADPNTLDDYEEGTFTPTITFSTPGNLAVTYTEQTGKYTKVGDLVYLSLRLWTSAFTHTTAAGTLRIGGLPFTPAGTNYYWLNLVTDGTGYTWPATTTQVKARTTAGATYLILKGLGPDPGTDSFTVTEMATGATVILDIDGWIKV